MFYKVCMMSDSDSTLMTMLFKHDGLVAGLAGYESACLQLILRKMCSGLQRLSRSAISASCPVNK